MEKIFIPSELPLIFHLVFFGFKKNPHAGPNPTIPISSSTENSNIQNNNDSVPSSSTTGGCPVKASKNGRVQYNVYSQPIDPKNNMPSLANQLPSANQNEKLSTERKQSTIPKV